MMRRAGKLRNGIRMMALFCLLALPLRAHAQCTFPSDGLIGHWTLDETSGTTANDNAGSNDGTLYNGMSAVTATAPGTIGTGMSFDGADDHIRIPYFAAMGNMNALTLAAWFKVDALSGTTQRILSTVDLGFTLYIDATDKLAFEVFASTSGYDYSEADIGGLMPDTWYHVAAIYQNGQQLKIYVNGVERTTWTDPASSGTIHSTVSEFAMGNDHNTYTQPFDGMLDDVRMYNRALSSAEIAALYSLRSTAAAPAGYMAYDAKHARMMYCNGTDWVHAGIGAYNPNGVSFDGSDVLAETSMSAGASTDTDKVTASFWVMTAAETDQVVWQGSGMGRIQIMLSDDGTPANGLTTIYFHGRNSSDNGIISVGSNTISTNSWHHVLISLDAANNVSHLYVDGVLSEQGEAITPANGNIDFDTQHNLSTGGAPVNASLADFWLDVGGYIDFSVEANRHKFRTPTGMPMYLGADGSLPTGTAPDIFLTGNTDTWHTNKGTGGGFTETGALATAASQPGDNIISSGDSDSGLIAYWALNETSGTAIAEGTGVHGGTAVGGLAGTNSVEGAIGTALQFDGVNDAVQIPNTGNLTNRSTLSVSAWIKPESFTDCWSGVFWGMIYVTDGLGSPDGYGFGFGPNNRLTFFVNSGPKRDSADNVLTLNKWQHVAMSWDGSSTASNIKLYVNGSEVSSYAVTSDAAVSFDDSVNDVYLGAGGGGSNCWFDGAMDEVRVYDRVLAADDVKLLYACSAPPGAMQYNGSYNTMSYCNGAEWVPMGPVGGTPPASGLVGHWEFDEGSGSTAADSSATNADGTLNAGPAWIDGKVSGALQFDGVDSYVGVPFNAALYGHSAITLTAWYKLSSFDTASNIQMLVNEEWGAYNLYFSEPDRIAFEVDTSGGWTYADGVVPTAADTWVFIAAVYESGSTIKVYANGVDVTTYTEPAVSGTIDSNGQNLWLGYDTDATTHPVDGALDDLRIYNRVLSDAEIQLLYHYGRSGGVGDVSGNCANPAKPEGSMVYNADHNVMQYCNGEQWIGIGQ